MSSSHEKQDSAAKSRGKAELKAAQGELVKLQRHVIESGQKVLVVFEGRDASGKDGTIKRIVQHLSPREARVVALSVPSDRERHAWYFQRYVEHVPVDGEIVLFNRSWYNRAGVERVMKFCSKEEYEMFLETAPIFEDLLIHCGVKLVKYYLDISKEEEKKRLKERREDPMSQWKLSPIDEVAIKHFEDYTEARNEMLARTHTPAAPWTIIRTDDKHLMRLNVIRDLLTQIDFKGRKHKDDPPDPKIVFKFRKDAVEKGQLAN
jgi:polyphosphate kinase 2